MTRRLIHRKWFASLSAVVLAASWAIQPLGADAAGGAVVKSLNSRQQLRSQGAHIGAGLNAPSSPESQAYLFTGESSGGAANASTSVVLLFEPGGNAELFAESSDEQLSYAGSWS
jgi:hypothetical protein